MQCLSNKLSILIFFISYLLIINISLGLKYFEFLKLIHDHFHENLENKEWYRCSTKYAISEIKKLIEKKIIIDKVHIPDLVLDSESIDVNTQNKPPNTTCAEPGCSLPPMGVYNGVWYCPNHWRIKKFNAK